MSDRRLQENFVILCQQLDIDRVVPVLRQEKMLTSDEVEMLTNPMLSTRAKRERLLIILPRKGRNHFEVFGRCLVWSGQVDLARRIGIAVESVPPSPFPALPEPPPSQAQLFQLFSSFIASGGQGAAPGSNPSSMRSGEGYPIPPPQSTIPPPTHHTHPQHPNTAATSGQGASNTHQQTRISADSSPRGHPQDGRKPKVFLLYCKDQPEGSPCTPDQFCDSVQDLADVLTRSGGLDCIFDGYDRDISSVGFPVERNWHRWTEEKIQESEFVLLVCSQKLSEYLQNPGRKLVDMMRGKFYADSIEHHIDPSKFIPVFLNVRPDMRWVPTNLKAATHYPLPVNDLIGAIGDTDGMMPEEFSARLEEVLGDSRFEKIVSLIACLRGESYNPRPCLPPTPVRLPQTQQGSPHYPPHPTYQPHPPTTNQAEYISEGDLLRIADRLPRDWQHLGIKLGVEYSILESLRTKNLFDTRQSTMEMFGIWQRTKGKAATRKSLKEALKSLSYGRVAKEVFPND